MDGELQCPCTTDLNAGLTEITDGRFWCRPLSPLLSLIFYLFSGLSGLDSRLSRQVQSLIAGVTDIQQTGRECPDLTPQLSQLNQTVGLGLNLLRLAQSGSESRIIDLLRQTVMEPTPHPQCPQVNLEDLLGRCVGSVDGGLRGSVDALSALVAQLSVPCPDLKIIGCEQEDWKAENQSCEVLLVAGHNYTVCWDDSARPDYLGLARDYLSLIFSTRVLPLGKKNIVEKILFEQQSIVMLIQDAPALGAFIGCRSLSGPLLQCRPRCL